MYLARSTVGGGKIIVLLIIGCRVVTFWEIFHREGLGKDTGVGLKCEGARPDWVKTG